MRKRFLSAFLVLVLLFSTVPTAAAASTEPDLTCKAYYGDEVKLPRSKFVDLLDAETGDDDLGYIEITDVSSDFDDYGWFSALDRNGKKTELKKAYDLETYYYYDEDYFDDFRGEEDVEYLLEGLSFHALENTDSGTVTVEFTVWNYDEDEYYDGILEIMVIGEDDDTFDPDRFDLVCEVDVDDETEISRRTLKNLFSDERDASLSFMEITDISDNFGDYGWFEAYRDGKFVTLDTASELTEPDFYYSASDLTAYGKADTDCELDGFSFVSDEDADYGWFTVSFILWDSTREEHYRGEIAVVVGSVEITNQPKDKIAEDGEDISFSIRTNGTELTYQWQYKKPGSSTWTNSGASTAKKSSLKITAAGKYDSYQYRCVVTDAFGNTVTSDPATLLVNVDLDITSNPSGKSIDVGEKTTFTVKAVGSGLTYQWQYKAPGGSWRDTSFSGNKTATLTVTAKDTMDGYRYRCVVTDRHGNTLTSSPAGLSVIPVLSVTSQPSGKTVLSGNKVTFSVKATGSGLTYQWYYRKPGGSWTKSSAASGKTATLSFTAKDYLDGYCYRCRISDAYGDSVYSRSVYLTLGDKLEITRQPYISYDSSNGTVKLRISATGMGVTYQWQYKTSTGSWSSTTRTGSQTSALDVTTSKTYTYRCVVKDGSGNRLNSDPITFTAE